MILETGIMIENAITYVKQIFAADSSGHDYHHTIRVYRLAVEIAKQENADMQIVQLAALLHDVDDAKLSPETYASKRKAVDFMKGNGVDNEIIETVCKIIEEVSFAGNDSVVPSTIEGKCVQDADRLDAIGAIGIARAFAYGGSKGRKIYDPEIKPLINMSKKGTGKLILGAGLGAGLALLFAPKKGSELREDLKCKINELVNKAKEVDTEEVKENLENKIDEIKKELEDLDKEKVKKIAEKKVEQLKKKTEELVEYAKEKGTPVLEKTAKDVKKQAANVCREVLKKLETDSE